MQSKDLESTQTEIKPEFYLELYKKKPYQPTLSQLLIIDDVSEGIKLIELIGVLSTALSINFTFSKLRTEVKL